MVGQVMELARSLGRVDAGEEIALAGLCSAACRELKGALREGVSPEDCGECFVLAGAWLALAGLESVRTAGQVESFSAGDVTIRSADGTDRAKQLRRQAMNLMSGWLRDRSFFFCGVSG